MLKRTQFLATFAFAASLAMPTYAETGADAVIATVNGTEITMGHMILVRSGLPDQYRDLPDAVLFKGILDQIIQETVLAQAGGTDAPKRVRLALENERRSLMAAEHMDAVLQGAVTRAAIEAAYEAKYTNGIREKEFDASHILVATKEINEWEWTQYMTDLLNGAKDIRQFLHTSLIQGQEKDVMNVIGNNLSNYPSIIGLVILKV